MHYLLLTVGGLLSGLAVGVTGTGGGALMTPMLVLLFGVDARVAIASDVVSSLIMKPVGGAVHARRGTVHWPLVGWLAAGSVPAALAGAYTLSTVGSASRAKEALGGILLLACASIVARMVVGSRLPRPEGVTSQAVRIFPTIVVGVVGGFIVGLTSVGSGSLMMVMLMVLYPALPSRSLVGTDLVQSVPLVAAATVGQLVWGHVAFSLAGALLAGAIPGVYLGARVSAKAPDRVVRPLLVAFLAAAGVALLPL